MKTKWIIYTLASFYSLIFVSIGTNSGNFKLLLVQMLYRHGDRTPLYFYPSDPNPKSVWPDGVGMLTKLGRQQHHNLGKFFRVHYKNFMTSDPAEVNVLSTESTRCIESAKSNLETFYPSSEAVEYYKRTSTNQIPIYFIPGVYDEYLGKNIHCPKYKAEEMKNLVTRGEEFYEKHKEMLEYYSIHTRDSIMNWKAAFMLYDTLFIEKRYNRVIPEWANTFWSELVEIADSSYNTWFNTDAILKFRAGPLLKLMIESMEEKIDGNTPQLKFQVFSAHDTNLAYLVNALKLNIKRRPPYCATLLFELYIGLDDSTFVRILYQNSTKPENEIKPPHILTLDGCEEFCPLEYFIKYTQHLIPSDFKEECKLSADIPQAFSSGKSLAIIAFISLAILITIVVTSYRRMWTNKMILYMYPSHHRNV